MNPRRIDPLSAVRFVQGYVGEPGRAFRDALAAKFGVSDKTVKRELPRLVEAGMLEEETLPGRGAPKAYRVPAALELSRRRFRRLIDGLPRRRRDNPLADPLFREAFDLGIGVFCPTCGWRDVLLHLSFPEIACEPNEPECGNGCRVREDEDPVWRGGDGVGRSPRMTESAYTFGLLARPDPPPPPEPEPEPEPDPELLARNIEALARLGMA